MFKEDKGLCFEGGLCVTQQLLSDIAWPEKNGALRNPKASMSQRAEVKDFRPSVDISVVDHDGPEPYQYPPQSPAQRQSLCAVNSC